MARDILSRATDMCEDISENYKEDFEDTGYNLIQYVTLLVAHGSNINKEEKESFEKLENLYDNYLEGFDNLMQEINKGSFSTEFLQKKIDEILVINNK